jgi:FkbM family methyltransferase
MIRTVLRKLSRYFFRFYKKEYGRYSILVKLFFPYLAPQEDYLETVKAYRNLKMELDSREYIQAMIYLFGDFEPPTIKFIESYIQKGFVIFDIGANVGYHTLIFSHLVGENGKVFSFEPEPENFATLNNNILINNIKNVITINKAVSDKKAVLDFYVSNSFNKGTHSLVYNPIQHSEVSIKIDCLPLNDFIVERSISKIDFIKIDVEGAEHEVIKGMESVIMRFKPAMLVEVNNDAQVTHGLSSKELKEYICNFGYDCYDILDNGDLQISAVDKIHNVENVVFLPKK